MQSHEISADTLLAVQPLFSAAEVLDLMAINSTYLFLACVAKTWNVELDLK
ncbi:MAG: hypothetical protein O2907_01410 [Proteobacteria bacterium]|nr:hypothetical protein [Pseudomonadota bacterium]MDA1062988.1 hypothetical protein [Pseudomonadota bacterium]